MIFSVDVAAMGQRRRDFDFKWYDMGVKAKVKGESTCVFGR